MGYELTLGATKNRVESRESTPSISPEMQSSLPQSFVLVFVLCMEIFCFPLLRYKNEA